MMWPPKLQVLAAGGDLCYKTAVHYVVAYDIEQTRRRTKVMNVLKDFGLRVQYSVFECDLTVARKEALETRLVGLIDRRRDKIHIYPLCDACFFRAQSLGLEGGLASEGRLP